MKKSIPKKESPKTVASTSKTKKQAEITPEQRIERDSQASFLLRISREDLEQAQLREELKKAEIIELLGGAKTTLGALDAVVTAKRQPYMALFPNTMPFWSEIFRLNNWTHRDPTEFEKPAVVGIWVCELIYDRFRKEILPTLRLLNPALYNGFREHKHFQFLTDEGQASLERFRDEAIELMGTCGTWYEFRKRLLAQYGVPFQGELFA